MTDKAAPDEDIFAPSKSPIWSPENPFHRTDKRQVIADNNLSTQSKLKLLRLKS